MSSIITFTYSSKWNPGNGKTLLGQSMMSQSFSFLSSVHREWRFSPRHSPLWASPFSCFHETERLWLLLLSRHPRSRVCMCSFFLVVVQRRVLRYESGFQILCRYLPEWPGFLWILWRTPVYLLPTFVLTCRDVWEQEVNHESRCYLFSLVHQDLRQDYCSCWYYYLSSPCSFDCMSS